MRKKSTLIHTVFLFLIILTLPVFLFKQFRLIRAKKQVELNHDHVAFANSKEFIQDDKRFVVVIVGRNHADFVEQSLRAALSQEYPSYRVVYIDGYSSDDSFEVAKDFVASHERKSKVTLIQSESKDKFCETYYNVIHGCKDNDVVVHINVSDWLSHENVLTRLNKTYQHQDVWLTYGQYLEYPTYKKGISKPQPRHSSYKKKVHRAPWVVSHLKTYYAGLFKQVKMHEDINSDYLLSMRDENKLMLPMVELAKNHVRFIPEVLYVHYQPSHRPDEENLNLAAFCEQFTGAMATSALASRKATEHIYNNVAVETDLIIFSNNRPHQLHVCLDSVARYTHGIKNIKVIYSADYEGQKSYDKLEKDFSYVTFINQNSSGGAIFKSLIMNTIFKKDSGSKYVALATDGVIINDDIQFSNCIAALEKNQAYGFYFHLGKNSRITAFEDEEKIDTFAKKIAGGLYSWDIDLGKGQFAHPDSLNMALYKKEDLRSDLKSLQFYNLATLIDAWSNLSNTHRIGLCFDQPKIFSIYPDYSELK